MNNLLLIIKGFIIGTAKILPGVSGAVMAISFGVYEELLSIVGHPFKIKFNDIKFLALLLFGAVIGILTFCMGIKWCLDKWTLATSLLFIGFIIGGFPEITVEIRDKYNKFNIFLFLSSILAIFFLTGLNGSSSEPSKHYFLMGVIESLTTIIPGISGTAIFMALGWYKSLLDTIHGILTFSAPINVTISFILGFIASTILIARILNYLFDKYKAQSYFCVMGFMCGSLLMMIADLFKLNFSFWELIIGVILFFIGIISTIKINNIFSNL